MGARASIRGLAYVVKSRAVEGGEYRPFATASCSRCGKGGERRLSNNTNNPERIQKEFRDLGWEFDSWNARRCTCPECVKARNDKRHGESGRRTEGATIVNLHPHKAPAQAQPARETLTLPTAAPPNKTDLTVDERARVRTLLGGTFDEKAGHYSEGWSDLRVAREAGDLPPKLIADLREAAFGPIREVVDLEPIKAEIAALEARLVASVKASDGIKLDLEKLRANVADVTKRLGVRQ